MRFLNHVGSPDRLADRRQHAFDHGVGWRTTRRTALCRRSGAAAWRPPDRRAPLRSPRAERAGVAGRHQIAGVGAEYLGNPADVGWRSSAARRRPPRARYRAAIPRATAPPAAGRARRPARAGLAPTKRTRRRDRAGATVGLEARRVRAVADDGRGDACGRRRASRAIASISTSMPLSMAQLADEHEIGRRRAAARPARTRPRLTPLCTTRTSAGAGRRPWPRKRRGRRRSRTGTDRCGASAAARARQIEQPAQGSSSGSAGCRRAACRPGSAAALRASRA